MNRRPGGAGPPDLAGLRVLVVDDEPYVRDAVTFVLEHFEATVTPAGSVREALAALRASRHHVLLSDLAMPEDEARARESGFDIHLGKPVEPIHLVEVVALLARRSPYDRADGDELRAAS